MAVLHWPDSASALWERQKWADAPVKPVQSLAMSSAQPAMGLGWLDAVGVRTGSFTRNEDGEAEVLACAEAPNARKKMATAMAAISRTSTLFILTSPKGPKISSFRSAAAAMLARAIMWGIRDKSTLTSVL
jgi:hypothetical protein